MRPLRRVTPYPHDATHLALLTTTIERLRAERAQQRAENQVLRDQVARLRGADWEPGAVARDLDSPLGG